jgi:hypothetical protein
LLIVTCRRGSFGDNGLSALRKDKFSPMDNWAMDNWAMDNWAMDNWAMNNWSCKLRWTNRSAVTGRTTRNARPRQKTYGNQRCDDETGRISELILSLTKG